jgi:hypothetical protein
MWRCGACGFVWEGEESPDRCHNCGAAKAKLVELEPKAQDRIERSRFANNLHVHLLSLLDQMMDLAEDGIDDNLDPACVRVFQRALDQADFLQKSIKAELQSHMNTGRWG